MEYCLKMLMGQDQVSVVLGALVLYTDKTFSSVQQGQVSDACL
jgi:hypothetical protein